MCPGSQEALPIPGLGDGQTRGRPGSDPQPGRVRVWGSARVGLLLCLAPPSPQKVLLGQDSAQHPDSQLASKNLASKD